MQNRPVWFFHVWKRAGRVSLVRTAGFCAEHLHRSGSIADSFTERNGSRAGCRYRNAFRHSARSIARQRERDHARKISSKNKSSA